MNFREIVLNWILNWIIFWRNSNIELNQFGYRSPLTKTLIWPISTTSTPPNIYIVGKLWIMAFCWPYPFTLPKFLQALGILLTPWDWNEHTSWDCVVCKQYIEVLIKLLCGCWWDSPWLQWWHFFMYADDLWWLYF